MSEWISKAANVFKRDVSETPQPFDVHCECGQKHAGVRRARHQHLVCKACGASLFVLPHDTYPPPHIPKTSEKKKRKRKKTPLASLEPIDLSSEPVLAPTERSHPDRRRKSEDLNVTKSEVEIKPFFLVRIWIWFRELVSGFWSVFWQFWTPYRKLALVIFCFVALTGFYSIRQGRLRNNATVVKTKLDEGLAAMDNENWVDARRHFERATESVDYLNRDDIEANTIRQYFRETTALTRLTSTTLFEVMEDAESYYVKHGADKWEKRFQTRYNSDWHIIEGYVRPANDKTALANGFDLELVFPLSVGKKQRQVNFQINFKLAEHLPKISNNGGHDDGNGVFSVFAAQLKDCFIGPDGTWIVRLNPDSCFFWVNPQTYEATHLQIGSIQPIAEQQQTFNQQGIWMGVRQ